VAAIVAGLFVAGLLMADTAAAQAVRRDIAPPPIPPGAIVL
jgi:hypothetical protein